jgi:putative DNA primase/helicase
MLRCSSRGTWILEIAELDALNRAGATAIKSYLGRSTDKFSPPYGTRVETWPRQCVFIGTTNADTYLKGETGNKRFWPIKCGELKLDELAADRDQLWAEAVLKFQEGAKWWLESSALEELAHAEQDARMNRDPWEVYIAETLRRVCDTSVEDLLAKLGKSVAHCSRADQMRVAAILQLLGWERYRSSKGKRPWRYRRGESAFAKVA